MQRESFHDPGIAERLNRDFIPVKLDRELNPALDDYLIGFVERTVGQVGWPLNVFLTPDGYLLVGSTYAPPKRFETLLQRPASAWSEENRSLSDLARRAAEERVGDQAPSRVSEVDQVSPDQMDLSAQNAEGLLASARSKLLAVRSKRGIPRDDEQLAGWNGVALSALAAARSFWIRR